MVEKDKSFRTRMMAAGNTSYSLLSSIMKLDFTVHLHPGRLHGQGPQSSLR